MTSAPTLVFAHRGASGHAPENTIAAFDLAVAQGTCAIESDVKLTRDRRLVLFHDWGVGKPPRYRPVMSLTLAGLRARVATLKGVRVPTVAEAFAHFRRRGLLDRLTWSLDVPQNFVAKRLWATCRAFGNQDRVLFCGERPVALRKWLRQGIPAANLVWSVRDRHLRRMGVEGVVRTCARLGVPVLNVKLAWASRRLAAATRRAGLRLFVWDVHDDRSLRLASSLSPDAVYTNYPDLALRALGVAGGGPTAAAPRPSSSTANIK
ncbi:MAG: glycerophosphodiester phosphodiesterase family protein [Promethearchaeota archaeon]